MFYTIRQLQGDAWVIINSVYATSAAEAKRKAAKELAPQLLATLEPNQG